MDLDRFFDAVVERRISDAEKELDVIRTAIPATESARGYLKACEGLILVAKAGNDKYLYLSKMEKNQLRALHEEFSTRTQNPLHADYDRAYFQVLEGYVKRLERSIAPSKTQTAQKKKKR